MVESLFKQASEESLSVDPAPIVAHEGTVDPKALKNYQNSLHGIVAVVGAPFASLRIEPTSTPAPGA